MIKNIVIALLCGVILGGFSPAKADYDPGVTRALWILAASCMISGEISGKFWTEPETAAEYAGRYLNTLKKGGWIK